MEMKQKNTESVTLFFPKENSENFTYDGKVLEFMIIEDSITATKLDSAEIYFSATEVNNIIYFLIDIGGEVELSFLVPVNMSVYTANIEDKVEHQKELEFRLTALNKNYELIHEKKAELSVEDSMQLKDIFLKQCQNKISYARFVDETVKTMNENEYEIMKNASIREVFYGKNKEEIYEA